MGDFSNRIRKLAQDQKSSKTYISLKTLYGSRYILFVGNLALVCLIIILSIISALLYFSRPVTDVSAILEDIYKQKSDDLIIDSSFVGETPSEAEILQDEEYSVVSNGNIFSPDRKEWVAKVETFMPKPVQVVEKDALKEESLFRKPGKIILHGIIIAGDVRKALINNPTRGVDKKGTIYVEKGSEIEGYRVVSIEPDHIKLDWQGEEIIVKLYSGLEIVDQDVKDVSKRDRRDEKHNNSLEDIFNELASKLPLKDTEK